MPVGQPEREKERERERERERENWCGSENAKENM